MNLAGLAAPTKQGQASVGQTPDQQASAGSVHPAVGEAGASQGREAGADPPAPKEPGQASAGQAPGQKASPASAQPEASAAAACQSSVADAAPAAEECRALRPHEQKVAAALLVVLRRAQQRRGGDYCMAVTKRIIMANNPLTSPFLAELPDDGGLPSLKQLENRPSHGLAMLRRTDSTEIHWPAGWKGALEDLAQQCATAAAEPLEVFTRSAVCRTHIAACHDMDAGKLAARLQRLQPIQASLPASSAAESKHEETDRALAVKVGLLAQHGIAPNLRNLILVTLQLTIRLLDADRMPENKGSLTTGADSSFTICIDHMLPGVLDGLLQHEGNDLTSVYALLKMMLPLQHALQSYKDRALDAGRSHKYVVMLEAAVQGWPVSAPTCWQFLHTLIEAFDLGTEAPLVPVPANPACPKPTPEEEHPFLRAQNTISVHCPDMLQVMEIAFCPGGLGCTNYDALCQILPGFFFPWGDESQIHRICEAYTLHTAKLVKQQIQVHKHIASMQKISLRLYLRKLLSEQGVDTSQALVYSLCETICWAADLSSKVDIDMARMTHIGMCIKTSESVCRNVLKLLDALVSLTIICAEEAASPQVMRAIHLALPGVLDSVVGLHKWPTRSDRDLVWLKKAEYLLLRALTKHAKDSHSQGLNVKEYTNKVLAVPGLQRAELELLAGMFEEFWDGQDNDLAAYGLAAPMLHQQAPNQAPSASPNSTPAASSTGAGKRLSTAKANGVATASGRGAAEACQPSQQRNNGGVADVAADILKGASSEARDCQGESQPTQGAQEAAQPESGLSEAEKAEKRKAKKARQRAARVQAASMSVQERSAEKKAAEQPPQAVQPSCELVSPMPEGLLAPKEAAHSSKMVASSRRPPLSPQPSLQLQDCMSHEAAPSAQAAASAAQDDDTWQEVRGNRRKSVRQQHTSNAGAYRPPAKGRGAPDQGTSAPSPSRPRELQAAAQHAKQAPLSSALPPCADPIHDSLPGWLSVLSTSSTPQHTLQCEGLESLQSLRPKPARPQPAIPVIAQHGPLQASQNSSSQDGAHAAAQPMPHSSGPSPGMPSQEQAATADESLSRERAQNDDILCIVCMENQRNVVFCNCGHLCACEGCAQDIMAAGGLCPICRASIRDILKVYF